MGNGRRMDCSRQGRVVKLTACPATFDNQVVHEGWARPGKNFLNIDLCRTETKRNFWTLAQTDIEQMGQKKKTPRHPVFVTIYKW